MKRILIMLLITIFAASMLLIGISCKEEAVEEEAVEEEAAEEEAAEEAVEEEAVEEDDEVVFAYISTRGTGSPWNNAHEDAIASLAAERGWTLYQYDCQMDVQLMISQIEEAITLDPDVLGFLDIDDTALGAPACKANAAGIPVIASMGFLDEEFWPCLTAATGASFVEQGRTTGALMYQGLVEKHGEDLTGKKVFVLQGFLNQTAAQERYDGFIERFTELAPEVEIVDVQSANWDQAEAQTITETCNKACSIHIILIIYSECIDSTSPNSIGSL